MLPPKIEFHSVSLRISRRFVGIRAALCYRFYNKPIQASAVLQREDANLNFFTFDIRKLLIVLFVAALPILSINMQRNPGEDPWYVKPISALVSLVESTYASFTSGVRGTTSMYLDLIGVKRINAELQRENAELRAKLAALKELEIKHDHLAKQLDFKQKTSMRLLAAQVIGRDLSPDHGSIRINRGSRDGLKRFQGVITVEGVVGYVFKVDRSSSQVLVLTDRSTSAPIDAIVQRTRARGLVSGMSRSTARLRYLERADDVTAGDMVVTSGIHGDFPKGFPIGRITSVRKTAYGISQEAELTPVVRPADLEEVFVILDSGEEDFTEEFDPQLQFGPPLLSKMNSPATEAATTNSAKTTTETASSGQGRSQ